MEPIRFLPRKSSSRLIAITFISGLIPIVIFSVLMNVFAARFLTENERVIRKGQEEQRSRSEQILKRMAEDIIRQKALDVALQLELYIRACPNKTVEDLQNDMKFRDIAVQPVGSGYTAVHDSATAVNRFHKDPKIQNFVLHSLSDLAGFWPIIERSLIGKYSYGYYKWKDPNGTIRDKFMYVVPLRERTADGVQFSVAATTYVDDFTHVLKAAQDVSDDTTRYLMTTVDGIIHSFTNAGFVFMVLGLLLVLALAYSVGIYFTRSLKELRKATSAVNRGNFDVRVTPVMSGDLGEFMEDFNQMVFQLSTTTVKKEQLEASEEKLRDINAKLLEEIRERKRAEDRLRVSETKYRTLFETANDGILMIRKDILIECNARAQEMFGRTREKLLGMTTRQLFREGQSDGRKSDEMAGEKIDLAFDGEPQFFEWSYIRSDGTTFDAEVSLSRIELEGQYFVQAMLREITERKRAEDALRESEELHRSIVENSHDGILIVSGDYRIIYGNSQMVRITGYTLEETLGRDFRDFIEKADRDLVGNRYLKRRSGEKVPQRYEFNVIRKDGERRRVEIVSTLIKDSTGDTRTLAQILDISEQKRAKKEKREMEARLQRAQKMEAIGTLAGGVAHDLNNILTGLVSYPELILMDLPDDSPLRKPVLTIQKSGERAAAIVQDLLTLARRGVAARDIVNLNDILSGYLKSPEFENLCLHFPSVRVETGLAPDLLNILGSSIHLIKTVMNLVANAAEAMPDGGTITILTENRYIDRPVRGYDQVTEGDYVILTIKDTGIGISSGDLDRIFEPFYTKKVMGRSGTGLGMAVVWGSVKDHNGYIDVESIEGQGTTFSLYFPATRQEAASGVDLLDIEDYRGKGESVLVIDDVEEQQEIAAKILKRLGYSVHTVSSGEEAVAYLEEHTVDLLVLDMIMDPGMDGLETYRKIVERHPGQKAVIASGFSETGRVRETQRLGAGAYVKKPFLMAKFGTAVRRELDK